MFEAVRSFDFQDILHLFKENEDLITGKFACEENIPHSVLLKNSIDKLQGLMNEDIICLALQNHENTIDRVLLVKKAEYDSEHFGLNIGKLELALFDKDMTQESCLRLFYEIKDEAAQHNLDVIFARIGLDQFLAVQSLERSGAILTDILLTFYINIGKGIKPLDRSYSEEVVEADKRDEKELTEMSRRLFKINHFHADSRLPKVKSDELYARWVSNSLNKSSDKVFVAKERGEVLGFIICKIENVTDNYKYGVVDLIGVKNEHKNKGIGFLLVTKALRWFSRFANSVYVGTQAANFPAIRLYQKAGFRQVYSEGDLHLWIQADRSH